MMSQEQLNGAQVSTVFEQVGSETVAQGVGMDSILQASASGGLAAGVIDGLGSDGMIRRMVAAPGEQPLRRFALQPVPVVAQSFQQDGTEHDISVLTAFPAANVDDHASAVDIGNLQAGQLGAPCPGAIERHQYDAMKPSPRRVDEEGHFCGAQYAGQVSRPLRIRCISHAPCLLNRLDEEEAQPGQSLGDGMCGEFPLAEQIGLVMADVLRTELIRRALEVTREVLDRLDVAVSGSLSVVTTLEFLEHHFAKVGHRSSPYDPTLSLHLVYSTAADTRHAKASAAKRLRSNRHVGDAEPGHQRHCWWLKHYLSAPPPGSDQSEPATCILYIEIVPPRIFFLVSPILNPSPLYS